MRSILLLFVSGCCFGCSQSSEIAALKASLRTSEETIVAASSATVTKADEAIVILKENTTALAAIKSQIEALKIVPEAPKGQEVVKSALESPPAKEANDSQPSTMIVAQPVGTRLTSDGTRLRWNIEGDWDPDILTTAKHLREDHGINTDGMTHQQMADLHASIHDGKKVGTKSTPVQFVNRGSSCPGGVCPTNTRSQRRGLFGWRR